MDAMMLSVKCEVVGALGLRGWIAALGLRGRVCGDRFAETRLLLD
jgi:hypothetical protein